MLYIAHILSLTLFLAVPITSNAEEITADLVIPLIRENSINKDKKLDGYHGKIIKQILDKSPQKITYQMMVPAHAYQAFYDKRYSCITPDTKHYYEKDSGFIDSEAISVTKWIIIQRVGSKIIFTPDDLKDLTVGTFYAPEEIATILPQEGVTYDVKADIQVNLLKVAMNRIDLAVLPYDGIAEMIAENEEFSGLTINASPPLATAREGIMCHDNERGNEIIEDINKTLKKLGFN